jgi:DNA-directed RNA polymerase specialized sigma subunit
MAFKRIEIDRHFQNLAKQIKDVIEDNEGSIDDQKEHVEKLMQLEITFREDIKRYSKGVETYAKFIKYITIEVGNMLTAKSYFREIAADYTKISDKMKNNDAKGLMTFHPNYSMIQFIVENWGGPLPKKVQSTYNKFLESRRELIENNLPLAINRAMIFYRKTPKNHLTLLDFIGICTCGLAIGIDKYVGKYTPVWRSVCIGRMVGFMIDEYSKTFIKMYPSDQKILYRTKALKYKLQLEDIKLLAKAVNDSFYEDEKLGKPCPHLPIPEETIRGLLNSSGYVSADSSSSETEDEEGVSVYDYAFNEEDNVEDKVEYRDSVRKISSMGMYLTVMERKIIRLKGVSI